MRLINPLGFALATLALLGTSACGSPLRGAAAPPSATSQQQANLSSQSVSMNSTGTGGTTGLSSSGTNIAAKGVGKPVTNTQKQQAQSSVNTLVNEVHQLNYICNKISSTFKEEVPMKKGLPTYAKTLIVATTAVSSLSVTTAFADDNQHHSDNAAWTQSSNTSMSSDVNSTTSANSSSTTNLQSLPPVLPSVLIGHEDDHGEQKDAHTSGNQHHENQGILHSALKSEASKADKNSNEIMAKLQSDLNHSSTSNASFSAVQRAEFAKLKAELSTYHQDVTAAKTAHQQLVAAAHDYITALQNAVAAGDAPAVQSGPTQVESIISTLRQALSAQAQVQTDADTSTHEEQADNLTQALVTIQSAISREETKTAAMAASAKSLESLAQSIQNEVSAYTASVALSTNQTSTTNTVTNVTVTTNNVAAGTTTTNANGQ